MKEEEIKGVGVEGGGLSAGLITPMFKRGKGQHNLNLPSKYRTTSIKV